LNGDLAVNQEDETASFGKREKVSFVSKKKSSMIFDATQNLDQVND